MGDVIFVGVLLAFFLVALGYVRLCDRIGRDGTEGGD